MPKLIVLAACEKVLFDDKKNPSPISIFCALDAAFIPDADVAPNAVYPRPWVVFTMWMADEADIGKQFLQQTVIQTPSGDIFAGGEAAFTMSSKSHNLNMRVEGIPVGMAGDIVITTWLELDHLTVTDHVTTPVHIAHRKS